MKSKHWIVTGVIVGGVVAWSIGRNQQPARVVALSGESPAEADPDEAGRGVRELEAPPEDREVDRPGSRRLVTSPTQVTTQIRLHGHARDQLGDPVVGRRIWLERMTSIPEETDRLRLQGRPWEQRVAETSSSPDGAFELDAPAPGDWWIGIAPRGDRDGHEDLYRLAEHLQLRADERDREVDLRAYRGLAVCGSVLNSDGSPVPNAIVEASLSVDGSPIARVVSDEHGAYCVRPLPPGPCFVWASMPNRDLPSDPQLTESGTTGVNLKLSLGGRCHVSVVSARTGEPVSAELRYMLRGGREDDGPWDRSLQGYQDTFDVAGLDDGDYDWIATTNSREIGVLRGVTVRADGLPQELVVRVAPSARLVIASRRGDQPLRARPSWEVELYSDGAFVNAVWMGLEESNLQWVPPGPIRLRVRYHSLDEPPTPEPEQGDYWMRKGVRVLDVVADESEERRVDLFPD